MPISHGDMIISHSLIRMCITPQVHFSCPFCKITSPYCLDLFNLEENSPSISDATYNTNIL